MRRRRFIAGLGSAAICPLTARTQQLAMPVIGFLSLGPPRTNSDAVVTFRKGLAEVGYVEGQNVAIEYRGANGQSSQLPTLAAELVNRQVAVIMTGGFRGPVLAAKAATSTIPIVFFFGGDPVEQGIVASLAHPGGNVTGVTLVNSHLAAKRLSLMLDLVPQATTVAYLSSDSSSLGYEEQKSQILAAANALGREVIVLEIRSNRDYEAAFNKLVQRQAGALILGPFAFPYPNEIIALAERYKIPAIYPNRSYVKAGGLMSYSSDGIEGFRHAGIYVGRILKGEKPADLPVIVTTKFHLVINLKAAKTLGLEIPTLLRVQANEIFDE
jgi:putative tryptophan/tyrosine transport system substrate-binding protein